MLTIKNLCHQYVVLRLPDKVIWPSDDMLVCYYEFNRVVEKNLRENIYDVLCLSKSDEPLQEQEKPSWSTFG